MKAIIAALLLVSTQAYAELCESGYCPEDGYPPVGRAYEIKHEPAPETVYTPPPHGPRIETYEQQYERQLREPSAHPAGVSHININKPAGRRFYD